MFRSATLWSGAVGLAGIPALLTGIEILSNQGRNAPIGWLLISAGALCVMGGSLRWIVLSRNTEGVEQAALTANADHQGRAFASGGPLTIGTYNEAVNSPKPEVDDSQGPRRLVAELRAITFQLGSNGRRYDLASILLMGADCLTTPTSQMTFQATIQNAIPQPDQPSDHKDVPPEILTELALHDVVDTQRVDPMPSAGSIRPSYHDLPHTSYQLTRRGKAVVLSLRAEQVAEDRTSQLAERYNEGKRLLLYEKDYASPPPAASLGGFRYSDLVAGEFKKWDTPTQQFIRDHYGVAEAALYGNKGWPLAARETIFDLTRSRLARLAELLSRDAAPI